VDYVTARLRHAGWEVRRQRVPFDYFRLDGASMSMDGRAYEAPRLKDPDREARVARSVEFFSSSPNVEVRQVADELARMPDRDEFLGSLDWMIDGVLAQAGAARHT
jgi:hypothetical protein